MVARILCINFKEVKMFDDYYEIWREKRISVIRRKYPNKFFRNKTLLEVGCGFGDIGGYYKKLGANVTVQDARIDFVKQAKEKYPNLKCVVSDLDKGWCLGNYDIIIHFGVLYHLIDFKKAITDACEHCNVLILETEVIDSNENDWVTMDDSSGYDQAYNQVRKGTRPSPIAIQNVLKECSFTYEMYDGDLLNSNYHNYNWEIENTKQYSPGKRKFWFCVKENSDVN
jgi:SAM-dependent methyltransferase